MAFNAQPSGIEALPAKLHIVGNHQTTTPRPPHIKFNTNTE
jgi:hypothetical protein